MDKEAEENYSGNHSHPSRFASLGFAHQTQEGGGSETSIEMVDYMLSSHPPPPHNKISLDKLSFADVMQFADFGPKLALNQSKSATPSEEESFFFKFQEGPSSSMAPLQLQVLEDGEGEEEGGQFSENASLTVQQQMGFGGGSGGGDGQINKVEVKNKRKRARSMKTNEEVESQRMTHIAVERNRRRQMNEHLRVLRSLMPGSYVQRGDQASIIGGAIEFLRELEQLLQCLESQKRRRLFGGSEPPRNSIDAPPMLPIRQSPPQPFFPPLALPLPLPLPLPCGNDNMRILELDPSGGGPCEDMAENKSCLADIEVRVLGYDAMIKILSRRRPGQLIKTIAALEDLQFNILHTNITTIEQTVLYSFNVKIMGETSCTAEDIANSVQQILSFIDTSTI